MPILLAYNQNGSGHYDAVAHIDQVQDKENVQPPLKDVDRCTCGRNSTKGVSCAHSLYHYSTKCPCFKANRACNVNCRCKLRLYKNPHGERPAAVKTSNNGLKGKRDRHKSQTYPLKGRKTAKVMEEVSEEVGTGSMSKFEYILISAIIHYSYPDIEDWTDIGSIETNFIAKCFEAIRNITQTLSMQLPIFKRKESEFENTISLNLQTEHLTNWLHHNY